ncbi:MAG: ABC transporter ATP-binding protein [Breznakia sp.]
MLALKNIKKVYRNGRGLHALSMEVAEGKICGLLGSNGCGKTTTFRLVLGLLKQQSGTITFQGKEIKDERIRLFGYLPEERSMFCNLSVEEQVRYLARLKKMSHEEIDVQLRYWLTYLDIEKYRNQKINELSKGNQQKVQIVCALIHNPNILIFDEPLSGLDVNNVDLFKMLLFKLKKEGKIVLLSSHQYNNIEHLCDDVYYLEEGRVIFSGNLEELKEKESCYRVKVNSNQPIQSRFIPECHQEVYTFSFSHLKDAYVCIEELKKQKISAFTLELISLQDLIARYLDV